MCATLIYKIVIIVIKGETHAFDLRSESCWQITKLNQIFDEIWIKCCTWLHKYFAKQFRVLGELQNESVPFVAYSNGRWFEYQIWVGAKIISG